ncbi:MAG: hypothetical protein ACO262_12745, partial [Vulcanococcus sp.]
MPPLSFRELQSQLLPEWGREHDGNGADFDLLMLPSLSVDPAELQLITGVHHYEERQLFSLIRLRDPGVRIVYVTSKLLPDLVVDAVLELLPGVPTSHARRRLHLFDTDDASSRPLTEKLLERPALLARIREWVRSGGTAHVTDHSNAAVTGLARHDGTGWSHEACAALRVPMSMLPTIVESSGVMGAASELPGAPPIAALVGDQQASLMGQSCVRPNRAKCTFGTGGMMDVLLGSTAPSRPERMSNGTFPIVAWSRAT